MQLQGWELGTAESIGIVILIGFSIDYVVHLSTHYVHSGHKSRQEKIKQSYHEIGISILAGAITTFGSGAFLFPAVLITFTKFAVIISSTVLFSFLYSMFFFGAMCHAFGVEGKTGDITACCGSKN
jgi:predicted RND superfamily exporter protein